jgi:blocked-early-in-transport protein 1
MIHNNNNNNNNNNTNSSNNRKKISSMKARSTLLGGDGKLNYSNPVHNNKNQLFGDENGLMLREKTEDVLEENIYEQTNILRQGVSTLKEISLSIYDEIRDQNTMLDKFSDDMDKTKGSLKFTLTRIGLLASSSSSRHMCLLMLFIMFVFFVLYLMIKWS